MELTVVLIRQAALKHCARSAARSLAVRGGKATRLQSLGPAPLSLSLDADHLLCHELRPLLSTMSAADVSLDVDWLDGDHQLNQRVRVTLRYRHPLFARFSRMGEQDFLVASTVHVGH